jgi:hypothetical protein
MLSEIIVTTKGTAENGTAVSSTDRAAIVAAAKLIAEKPAMKPATALRKAGIKSAAKIKRLSPIVLKRQTDKPDKIERSGTNSKKQKASAKHAKAAALSGPRGPTKNEAPSAPAEQPSERPPVQREGSESGTVNWMDAWAEQNVRWWSQVMRWSPFGIMLLVMTDESKRLDERD